MYRTSLHRHVPAVHGRARLAVWLQTQDPADTAGLHSVLVCPFLRSSGLHGVQPLPCSEAPYVTQGAMDRSLCWSMSFPTHCRWWWEVHLIDICTQALSLKLGVATERDLAQACRTAYRPWINVCLWIIMEVRPRPGAWTRVRKMTRCVWCTPAASRATEAHVGSHRASIPFETHPLGVLFYCRKACLQSWQSTSSQPRF